MKLKVLAVEDNKDGRELFAMMIRHLGYEILLAEDAESGVKMAMEEKPGIIFMDLCLPHHSGFDAISRLRSHTNTRDIPIIVYTAWISPEHLEASLRSGAAEVLTKPISFKSLQEVLHRYIPPRAKEIRTE